MVYTIPVIFRISNMFYAYESDDGEAEQGKLYKVLNEVEIVEFNLNLEVALVSSVVVNSRSPKIL